MLLVVGINSVELLYNIEQWVGRDVEGSLWYRPGILQERQRKTMKISRRAAVFRSKFAPGTSKGLNFSIELARSEKN
jgi:hypothetical protein